MGGDGFTGGMAMSEVVKKPKTQSRNSFFRRSGSTSYESNIVSGKECRCGSRSLSKVNGNCCFYSCKESSRINVFRDSALHKDVTMLLQVFG